ncbi:baculoviral IAP repeat-containing protein 5b [Nothobranchius furzeri]|uniref:Baculoviral IAP repeat-containing protein 5.1-A-like n=1 Tax=Nothobranchius furzeri TaxID=105023 RepID=A0A8C6NPR6_NOTFU|nr:baculoviral IAP repeat-containing protein 5b [Nothobranchius furzeri]KAF7209814.1 baculoviral IAP repeat-containing protein 5.1-A-like [Nothobranchius furzeri]
MARRDELTTRFLAYDKMYCLDMREQSFTDWPFREDCNCTPEKMATAGFVHCPSENEPDVTCCFFCLLELEGWEPDDDPWYEHEKRSPNCGFLSMKKCFTELTMSEFCDLEKERMKTYMRKICHKNMAFMREKIDRMLEDLKSRLESI